MREPWHRSPWHLWVPLSEPVALSLAPVGFASLSKPVAPVMIHSKIVCSFPFVNATVGNTIHCSTVCP